MFLFFILLFILSESVPVYNYSIRSSNFGYEGTFTLVDGEGTYRNDAKELSFAVYFESEYRVHIKIFDPSVENVW
jgi:hypothetical protein